jgi:hypothetical protein
MYPNSIFKALIVLVLAGTITSGPAFCADAQVTKAAGESDAAFVKRITKHEITSDGAGNQQLASTPALIKGSQTLIAFTEVRDPADPEPGDHDIYIEAFLQQSGSSYARIGDALACESEGGPATVRSFFYTALNGASDMAVGVICGWDSSHPYADCQANDEVRFFTVGKNEVSAVDMDKFEKVFYKQAKPDKHSNYKCSVSKFKTAGDVKNLLRTNR